jgi:hypothetical protein
MTDKEKLEEVEIENILRERLANLAALKSYLGSLTAYNLWSEGAFEGEPSSEVLKLSPSDEIYIDSLDEVQVEVLDE